MRDEIGEVKTFKQLSERVVEEVKVFEEREFKNGKNNGQCGLFEFCAEEADERLGKQEECKPPFESGVEDIACCQEKPASIFGRQA